MYIYRIIPIDKLAKIGFIKYFDKSNFILIFLLNAIKLINMEITWHITVANAAPATPPKTNEAGFTFTNIKFKISLIDTPIESAITGTLIFPSPWRAPFIVCSSVINTIEILLIWNINSPLLAFGNNICKIGFAKTTIPTLHGSPINIVISIAKDTLFSILL